MILYFVLLILPANHIFMEASKLKEKDQQVLNDLLENVKKQTDLFLGYPVS